MTHKHRMDIGYNGDNPDNPWTVSVRDAEWHILEAKSGLTLIEAIEHLGYEVFASACRRLKAWHNHLRKDAKIITRMDRDDARAQIRGLTEQIRNAVTHYGYAVPDDIRSLVL